MMEPSMARAIALGVVIAAGLSAPVQATDLVGHTAVYDVTLDSSTPASGLTGADGRLVVEFDNLCDGYVLTERMVVEMQIEGGDWLADYFFSAHEPADSSGFRFTTRTRARGETIEDVSGEVVTAQDGARRIDYVGDRPDIDLSAKTMMPVQMTRALIEAAESGAITYQSRVVDGVIDSGAYDVFAAIRSVAGDESKWRVDLSFFDPEVQDATPSYETSFEMFADGRIDNVVMRYEGFALRAELSEIDLRPADCG
jgi:hypothetical protein